MNTIWVAFITGLTTGGLSCLAVQGGLLTSSISSVEGSDQGTPAAGRWRLVTIFLLAKLIAYTGVGYLLGMLGSSLTLSPSVLGMLQIIVGLFMLATAARILDLHPMFRYFVIQPPRWVYRMLKNKSREASALAPAMLGFLTVLMPCGVTQATMAVAVATGSPLMGAAVMFAFVLGTSPVFFALGASVVELLQRRSFSYLAAGVIAVFAVLSINGGLGLRGSFYTLQNLYTIAVTDPATLAAQGRKIAVVEGGVQDVLINVASNGYTTSASTLKLDMPVRLTLKTNNTGGCARAFTIPSMNISKVLPVTGEDTIEFIPNKPGRLAYSCSMGMYTGAFNVIP